MRDGIQPESSDRPLSSSYTLFISRLADAGRVYARVIVHIAFPCTPDSRVGFRAVPERCRMKAGATTSSLELVLQEEDQEVRTSRRCRSK
jgi:hypothetical protein